MYSCISQQCLPEAYQIFGVSELAWLLFKRESKQRIHATGSYLNHHDAVLQRGEKCFSVDTTEFNQ